MTIASFLITALNTATCQNFGAGFTDTEGCLTINDQLTLELRPASTTDDWETALEASLGAVLVLDSPTTFHHAPTIIQTMQAYKPVPFIIAVMGQTKPSPDELAQVRAFFPQETEIKIFPCITDDAQSAQNVLLALIYQLLS